MKVDNIIIGSGISGLTAAAILARLGRSVAVIERNRRVGGSLRRFKRNGVAFDTGFHYTGCLGKDDILYRLWDYLGLLQYLDIQRFPDYSHENISFFDSSLEIPLYFSYKRSEEELSSLFPQDTEKIREYFRTVREVAATIPFYNFDVSLNEFFRDYWKPSQVPVKGILSGISDNRLVLALLIHLFLYGVPASQASLGTHAMVAHAYLNGAYHIVGGGQAVIDSYLKILRRAGVEIFTSMDIERIDIKDGAVHAVCADGEFFRTENVIYTGHPSRLFDLLPESFFRPAYVRRLRGLINTPSMFVAFCSLNAEMDDYGKSPWINYYALFSDEDMNSSRHRQLDRLPVMLTAPSVRDGTGKQGAVLLRESSMEEVLAFDQHGEEGKRAAGYEAWKRREGIALCNKANMHWFGSDEALELLETSSPLTFRDELGAPEGTVYGAMHSINQLTPSHMTRLRGLYLSGQSILMTGIVGASLSSLVTVGEIVGKESLWERITGS